MHASIFVTDDDEVVRASITRRLARGGHDVRSSDSGEPLLEELDHDVPAIILLNVKMWGMTGIETLKHIRPKAPQTLVALLTAYGNFEDAVEAMRLGAYDFLIKSVYLSGVSPVRRALDYLTLRPGSVLKAKTVPVDTHSRISSPIAPACENWSPRFKN